MSAGNLADEKPVTQAVRSIVANAGEVPGYDEILGRNLEARGISNIESSETTARRIKITDLAFGEDTKRNLTDVMERLGIPETEEVLIVGGVLTFDEKVSGPQAEIFPNRPEKQKLNYYVLVPNVETDEPFEAPLAIFSHGGSIRPETILKSPFLGLIQKAAERNGSPLIIGACDHRGSASEEDKVNYNLEDRRADLEILTSYLTQEGSNLLAKQGVAWNQNAVTLIGNSMGGHVATLEAEFIRPSRLILAQPAAYSIEAHYAPLGPEFTRQIRQPDSWKRSPAYDALEHYLRGGGDALIIGATDDQAVPGGITRRYMKEVTYAYVDRAARAEGTNTFELGYMWIPETHTRTTPDEILSIAKRSCE